jgi:hypothetical protein
MKPTIPRCYRKVVPDRHWFKEDHSEDATHLLVCCICYNTRGGEFPLTSPMRKDNSEGRR